ncbi:MAG: hypothetical protein L7F78_14750, partial [Syntrophales bacterium LBB04]|nr:hypothetical protein [Syntrophales bacterium LBB04]
MRTKILNLLFLPFLLGIQFTLLSVPTLSSADIEKENLNLADVAIATKQSSQPARPLDTEDGKNKRLTKNTTRTEDALAAE